VDGVHCRINELVHPTLAKNTKLYSHKFNQAGLDYELALSVRDLGLVWMNGPFVGSKHDVTVFREHLKGMTPVGAKGIADKGYRGERGILCTPSSYDNAELRKFKVCETTSCAALFELLLNWLQLTNNCFENRHEHVHDMKHSTQGLKVIPVLTQDFAMAWSVTNNALKPYVS
jgi:hypothetical protein